MPKSGTHPQEPPVSEHIPPQVSVVHDNENIDTLEGTVHGLLKGKYITDWIFRINQFLFGHRVHMVATVIKQKAKLVF